MSFSELKNKIQTHSYIYQTDMERYMSDGKRKMAKLLQEFDKCGIETELFEEGCETPRSWHENPISRELLYNSIKHLKEIHLEILIDIERETEGFVSSEALTDIDAKIDEEWNEE